MRPAFLGILLLLAACAPHPPSRTESLANQGELPRLTAEELLEKVPVRGRRVVLHCPPRTPVSGELLAVGDGQLWMGRGQPGGTVWAIQLEEVDRVRIVLQPHPYAALVPTLGALSTLSHGKLLLLSAPVWLTAGVGSGAGIHHQLIRVLHEPDFPHLYEYARFPAGLPEGFADPIAGRCTPPTVPSTP